MGAFSWLHISDLHIGHKDIKNIDSKWSDLCSCIANNDALRSCSYVFITGDIFDKGIPRAEVQDDFLSKLNTLRETFALDTNPIFFWSFGNHDITFSGNDAAYRKGARIKTIKDSILEKPGAVALHDNFIEVMENGFYSPLFRDAFDEAQKFVSKAGFNSNVEYDSKGLNGFYSDENITICILNTSVAATEDSKSKGLNFVYDGGLFRKLDEFHKQKNKDNPVFVLAHHDLNYLNETNVSLLQETLRPADVYLCGHTHKAKAERSMYLSGILEITAGSLTGCKEDDNTGSASFNFIFGLYNGNGAICIKCFTYGSTRWDEDSFANNGFVTSLGDIDNIKLIRLKRTIEADSKSVDIPILVNIPEVQMIAEEQGVSRLAEWNRKVEVISNVQESNEKKTVEIPMTQSVTRAEISTSLPVSPPNDFPLMEGIITEATANVNDLTKCYRWIIKAKNGKRYGARKHNLNDDVLLNLLLEKFANGETPNELVQFSPDYSYGFNDAQNVKRLLSSSEPVIYEGMQEVLNVLSLLEGTITDAIANFNIPTKCHHWIIKAKNGEQFSAQKHNFDDNILLNLLLKKFASNEIPNESIQFFPDYSGRFNVAKKIKRITIPESTHTDITKVILSLQKPMTYEESKIILSADKIGLGPLGSYLYSSGEYSISEAFEKLESAKLNGTSIICLAISFDVEKNTLTVDFHGLTGYVKMKKITQNARLKPQDIVGKTTRVCVIHISSEQKSFEADRSSIEREALQWVATLQSGDLVRGMIKQVQPDAGCSFVDLAEGYCAYLPLRRITRLPSTCCNIENFVKIGDEVTGAIYGNPSINLKISLLEYGHNWITECKDLCNGSIIEGVLLKDRSKSNIYYLPIGRLAYITVETEANYVLEGVPTSVRITHINQEQEEIFGQLENGGTKSTEGLEPTEQAIVDISEDIFIQDFDKCRSMFSLRIKANISPFAVRQNEAVEFANDPISRFNRGAIEKSLQQGHLGNEHKEILLIIRKLGYCTSKQLLSYLYSYNLCLSIVSQDKLNKKLEQLANRSLVFQMCFEGEDEGDGAKFRVYALTDNGTKVLDLFFSAGKYYSVIRPFTDAAHNVKRYLASNQFSLACMERIPTYKDYFNQRILYTKDDAPPVRPTGLLQFENCTLIIESIRRYSNWESDFAEKLERYQLFFREYDAYVINSKNPKWIYERPLYLLYICEDIEHTQKIHSFTTEYAIYRRTFFTYDLLLFQVSPEFSIFRFAGEYGRIQYYSLPDLLECNNECCTASYMDGFTFHDSTFNTFPEQYLRNTILTGQVSQMSFHNLIILDLFQDATYLHNNDIEGFLESSAQKRKAGSTEAVWKPRVFFFGNGGSGKTSLIKTLSGQPIVDREPKTSGVQVLHSPWKGMPWLSRNERYIEHVDVWDFAGQEFDHSFSSFLMSDSALYILVLDARSEDIPDNWLDKIKTHSLGSRVMLVINKLDSERLTVCESERNHFHRLNLPQYKELYDNIVGIYQVSCMNPDTVGNEIEQLKRDICSQLLDFEDRFQEKWKFMGAHSLREWLTMNKADYIFESSFFEKHTELGLDDWADPRATLSLCIDAGFCIPLKPTYLLLNPQWLTYGMSKILDSNLISGHRWQLTKENIKKILNTLESDAQCKYLNKENDFLEMMKGLKICLVNNDDEYIFPCLLSYPTKINGLKMLSTLSGWYERQFIYDSLPPITFPILQAEFWDCRWNEVCAPADKHDDFEPDRGKIVFKMGKQKMLAYREKNTITIAIEKSNPSAERLTDEERKAMEDTLYILDRIHRKGKPSIPQKSITESIVLKGRRIDPTMEKARYPYDIENLQRIQKAGIAKHYFPEVNRQYDITGLLLGELTNEKILDIYKSHLVHVFKRKKDTRDDEREHAATGFLLPYMNKWYFFCCAHTVQDINYDFIFESSEGYPLSICERPYISEEQDIAVYSVRIIDDEENWGIPKTLLSFQESSNTNADTFYCQGYTDEKVLETVNSIFLKTSKNKNARIIKNRSKNDPMIVSQEEGETFRQGFNGAPVMDLSERSIIGMIYELTSVDSKSAAFFVPIEEIWCFLEDAVDRACIKT